MGKLRCFEPGIFALACWLLAASAGAEGARSSHQLGLGGKERVLAGHPHDYRAATIKPMLMTSRVRGGGGQQKKQHRGSAGHTWQRRIMVTGGCGFVGSVLVDRLSRNYPEYLIVVLDRLDDCASEQSIAQPLSRTNCILVKGDVCDAAVVEKIMTQHSIDTIMHLAAQSCVDKSFDEASKFVTDNIMGTTCLLEACRKKAKSIRLFFYCSTDEVYGGVPEGVSGEDAPLNPANPYSATKAAAEHMVMAYHQSFGIPVVITRTCNMYGRNQFPEKVIPRFILLSKRGLPCSIHGKGDAVRSFLYVEDAAEAFDVVMHRGSIGEVYNIGSSQRTSVRDLADMIVQRVRGDGTAKPHVHVQDRAINDCRYALDCSKIEALGWTAKTSFEQGLEQTIAWYGTGVIEQGHWKSSACEIAVMAGAQVMEPKLGWVGRIGRRLCMKPDTAKGSSLLETRQC